MDVGLSKMAAILERLNSNGDCGKSVFGFPPPFCPEMNLFYFPPGTCTMCTELPEDCRAFTDCNGEEVMSPKAGGSGQRKMMQYLGCWSLVSGVLGHNGRMLGDRVMQHAECQSTEFFSLQVSLTEHDPICCRHLDLITC